VPDSDETLDRGLAIAGAVAVLFDPSHPHCTKCGRHLNMDNEPTVLCTLKPPPGAPALLAGGLAMLCLPCAEADPEVLATMIKDPDYDLPTN